MKGFVSGGLLDADEDYADERAGKAVEAVKPVASVQKMQRQIEKGGPGKQKEMKIDPVSGRYAAEVRRRFETFCGGTERLDIFGPLKRNQRFFVMEMCKIFGVKPGAPQYMRGSKKGDYVEITRTARTGVPERRVVDEVVKRFAGGSEEAGKKEEGRIVAGEAKPLWEDSSNIGFQMAVRMGWDGGGLGAEGNKGSLQPVVAVVKSGRAGVDSPARRKTKKKHPKH